METNYVGLKFFLESGADLTDSIRATLIELVDKAIADAAVPEKKPRKAPNKSGYVQIDKDTKKIIAEFGSLKEVAEGLGRDLKKVSGVQDAVNSQTTHFAYGFIWYHKDELDKAVANGHLVVK